MKQTKREKLQDLIEAELRTLGHKDVKHCDLKPATGHWRSSPYADVFRFEGTVKIDGRLHTVVSWDTMTDLCKSGVAISFDGMDVEVHRKGTISPRLYYKTHDHTNQTTNKLRAERQVEGDLVRVARDKSDNLKACE